jgi:hypothetical protein
VVRVTTLRPTPEQDAIVEAYLCGANLVIQAGAGTGKTSSLRLLAQAQPGRRGLYVAYNRAIASDARASFPRDVTCKTAHALAFGAVGRQYKHRLDSPRMPARQVAIVLGISGPIRLGPERVLTPAQLARIVNDTVTRFCYSADPEITGRHVPVIDGLKDPATKAALRELILPWAHKAWADLTRLDGRLPFSHDHYLKLWALTKPTIPADYVLLDEAQDANPVVADLVERQTHAQRILVGDSAQAIYCQPTGTMVRVPVKVGGSIGRGGPVWGFEERPIESLKVGDRVVSYSQGRRLGTIRKRGCVVSGVARRIWHGSLIRVTTPSGYTSQYTGDHQCVVMLGDALRGQWAVYLARRGGHYRVGACEGRYASQDDAFGPVLRGRQRAPTPSGCSPRTRRGNRHSGRKRGRRPSIACRAAAS